MPKPRQPRPRGLDFVLERDHAETVECDDCGADIGETCTRTAWLDGTTRPLDNLPAHLSRLRKAGPIPDHPQENHP